MFNKKKPKPMKEEFVKVCPRCRSIDIGFSKNRLAAFGLPQTYFCRKCGFRGYSFPEINIKELENESKNRK